MSEADDQNGHEWEPWSGRSNMRARCKNCLTMLTVGGTPCKQYTTALHVVEASCAEETARVVLGS